MFNLFFGIGIVFLLSSFLYFNYFLAPSRLSIFKNEVSLILYSVISSNVAKFLLYFLFVSFILINLLGNVPFNSIPTMFYSFTFSISFTFWVSIIICVSLTQINEFLAHMLPYGAPTGLILFLPLIEIFSQIIRPFTLIIRLSTNLSSGHIIIYMFSYFTLLSSVLSPFIYGVMVLLFALEFCISILQAYIFTSLVSMYIQETL